MNIQPISSEIKHNKNLLAIIPARAGSKGIPGKNIKRLLSKPLISWTIEEAKKSNYINRILISTDDEKITSICDNHGIRVPFLRPKELAEDDTPIIDVVLHHLDYLNSTEGYLPDFVMLLQPTSPLRTSYDIDKAFQILIASNTANAIVSITEVSEQPYWMRIINNDGFVDYFMEHNYKDKNRQELPATYIVNGALYICRTEILLKNKTFTPEKTIGYKMPRDRSIDIDDIIDFKLAEVILLDQQKRRGE